MELSSRFRQIVARRLPFLRWSFLRLGLGTKHLLTHWRTTEHETHAEYQTLLKDLVLESEYRG